eukprot:1177714-Prorocentrum_minimum.AAC.4
MPLTIEILWPERYGSYGDVDDMWKYVGVKGETLMTCGDMYRRGFMQLTRGTWAPLRAGRPRRRQRSQDTDTPAALTTGSTHPSDTWRTCRSRQGK